MKNIKEKKFIVLLVYFITQTTVFSQINTDRPDQSDGVYTMPKNKFQLENGITIAENEFINNLMLRFGLTNSTELRFLLDAGKSEQNYGLFPLTLSIKQQVLEQNKFFPAVTLVGYLSYGKIATRPFQADKLKYELKLAFENELSDQFSLGYNIGTSENFTNLNLTLCLGYSVSERISTFVEYFSTYNSSSFMHNFDTGILFLLSPKLQLDLALGRSIFAGSDYRFFTTFGVSY